MQPAVDSESLEKHAETATYQPQTESGAWFVVRQLPSRVSPITWVALLISLAGVFAALFVSGRIFERVPHIEDEIAYVWQAGAIARGELTTPTPPCPSCFLVPFVVDHNGLRFGKYPLAWPVVLSFGVRLGVRHLVNPLLAGLGLWLIWRLGKKLFNEGVGVLAAFLTLTSPFFLMNSGSLLSHPWALVLSAAFALAWLETFDPRQAVPRWVTVLLAGLALGALALTRPLTALGVGLPFAVHGLILLFKGSRAVRLSVLAIGVTAVLVACLHFVWQYTVTGDPLMNPYTLWWPYDTVGFGPGVGRQEAGYTLDDGRVNVRFALWVGNRDVFGWPGLSWMFLPFGLWAARRSGRALLIGSVGPSLVIVYLAYWIGSWLLGPRYYYEGLYSVAIISAAGILFLAGPAVRFSKSMKRGDWLRILRPAAVVALVTALVGANLMFYTPLRLSRLYGLYGMRAGQLEPFQTKSAQQYAPAIIVVHKLGKWVEYGGLLELESPLLDSPFIFLYHPTPDELEEVKAHFPERKVFHYYIDTPYKLYTAPRE